MHDDRPSPACAATLARLATLACVTVLLLAVSPARAFVQETTKSGEGLHWKARSLVYRIHEAGTADVPGEAEFDAVHRSFRTWQDEDCLPVTFTYAGPTADARVGFPDGAKAGEDNLVIWRADPADWGHSRTVIGLTSVWYDTRTGEIVDADIELNDADFTFAILSPDEPPAGRTDVENAVTHEVGHVLGLGHSLTRSATMYARSDPGDIEKRTLANDDVDGICTMYVDDGGGGCAGAPGAGPSGGAWLLLFPLAFWLRRRASMTVSGAQALVGVLLASGALLLGVGPASAYVLYTTDDGVPLRWWNVPVPYVVDSAGTATTSGETLLPEVDAAFATWEAVECAGVTFRSDGLADGLVAGHDNRYGAENENAIVWVREGWRHGARVIGLTTLTFHPVRGEIVDADVEFNEVDFDFTTSGVPDETTTDVRNALTHEIGHFLGLDHSLEPTATMAARSAPGDLDKRDLMEDDVAGFCAIYESVDFEPDPGPEPSPVADTTSPTRDATPVGDLSAPSEAANGDAGGCAATRATLPASGALLLLFALSLGLAALRRRRV